jgi:ATP-dependent DNA helicase PIF1
VQKVRKNRKAKDRWINTRALVIDEISMIDGDLFDKLNHIGRSIRKDGRPWGGLQLILTGDFFQLPPVPDNKSRAAKFAFDAATWNTSIDHTIGLTQVFRQRDADFAAVLNEMRLGKVTDQALQTFQALSRPLAFNDGIEMTELFPTRAEVESANLTRLRALPGEVHHFTAVDTGDQAVRDRLLQHMMAPKTIELKVGAQVMLIKNIDQTLVNGSIGKIKTFMTVREWSLNSDTVDLGGYGSSDDLAEAKKKIRKFSSTNDDSNPHKFPVVEFLMDGTNQHRTLHVVPEEWKVELPNGEVQAMRSQIPLILAWALSIHKAQGQTLARVKVNLGRTFEKGQAYVALSRATSKEGLQVLKFDKSKVMAHPRVVHFYEGLGSAEDAAKTRSKKQPTLQSMLSTDGASAEFIDLTENADEMAYLGSRL